MPAVGPGWSECAAALTAQSICWIVLVLSVWPLVPRSVQTAVAHRIEQAKAFAQDWEWTSPFQVEEAPAVRSQPEQTCAPVCIHLER